MENLNTQQIILLTLLVSFVTSIATGITTVSLLDQAPAGVTQTINHVVEKTIQTVVPIERPAPNTPPKEVTVVVKEEELVVKAVENIKQSIVRIKNKRSEELIGMGIIVKEGGIVAADASIVSQLRNYQAVYKGALFDLEYIDKDVATGIALFRLPAEAAGIPMAFVDIATVKPGQSIIAVSGGERDVISIGIIASTIEGEIDEGKKDATSTPLTVGIDTTIGQSGLFSGTPFSNLDGKLVAIKAGKNAEGIDTTRTVNLIQRALTNLNI